MRTPITWFVKNPVATNLMMMIFLASGVLSYLSLNQEEFPDIDFGMVQVSVAYLGATPEESESGVCLRIEEALEGAEDIDQMTSTARGPRGVHVIDFFPGFGQGSNGTGGAIPQIRWSFGPASPGNDRFALRLTNAAPDANAWLLIGRSRSERSIRGRSGNSR